MRTNILMAASDFHIHGWGLLRSRMWHGIYIAILVRSGSIIYRDAISRVVYALQNHLKCDNSWNNWPIVMKVVSLDSSRLCATFDILHDHFSLIFKIFIFYTPICNFGGTVSGQPPLTLFLTDSHFFFFNRDPDICGQFLKVSNTIYAV